MAMVGSAHTFVIYPKIATGLLISVGWAQHIDSGAFTKLETELELPLTFDVDLTGRISPSQHL